ncbi:helix-turn-helix domain-containing protein [Amphritea japonica]|uniref:Transcriptional regulator n=1 Tax=Amphritea japonica ATCC BAA-1530 TaxID=1278309 RepID=A0A7R6P2K4_9GAMM|nr:helix-turn-helix transcriptional regulator [Amphritea japonica]BBB24609.1 transcriptional regulator [Amphritea japonica ATCC BAA-1530]
MTPFSSYLESLRRSRRIKQKDFANEVGVSSCYISAIELGRKNPPSHDIIESMIKALQLSSKEASLLWDYAEQSIRVLRIPEDLPLEEYAVVNDLKRSFGSLSKEQITIIRATLSIRSFQQEQIQ